MTILSSVNPTVCVGGGTIVARKSKKSQNHNPKDFGRSPPRITSNVKQNLQFLKLVKELQNKGPSIPKSSTSYRRKKLENEDLPPHRELYQDPSLSFHFTNLEVDSDVPVLLVDGYNMCGYWGKLKKHFMNGQLDLARQKLIDELVSFSLVRDVVYSGDSSADSWIEKEVEALREDGCSKVWVITSDRDQQHAANGAGALVWSCKALISEINTSKKEMEQMLQKQRSTSMQGKLLKHNLNSEVVDALKDLRKQLSDNESK